MSGNEYLITDITHHAGGVIFAARVSDNECNDSIRGSVVDECKFCYSPERDCVVN